MAFTVQDQFNEIIDRGLRNHAPWEYVERAIWRCWKTAKDTLPYCMTKNDVNTFLAKASGNYSKRLNGGA